MSFSIFFRMRAKYKLGEAIAQHDFRRMETFLSSGVREIDYLHMRPADFGNGSTMVPDARFFDAAQLAEKVNLPEQGWALLRRYGMAPAAPIPTASPALGLRR